MVLWALKSCIFLLKSCWAELELSFYVIELLQGPLEHVWFHHCNGQLRWYYYQSSWCKYDLSSLLNSIFIYNCVSHSNLSFLHSLTLNSKRLLELWESFNYTFTFNDSWYHMDEISCWPYELMLSFFFIFLLSKMFSYLFYSVIVPQ